MPKLPKFPIKNIPIFSVPDEPIESTSQDFVPIADITENIVLHKDGGASLVMESTSLNFGLLSEREREAVVAAYAALINSLSFPVQIVVRTKRKDIKRYLNYLDTAINDVTGEKLRDLSVQYRQFIEETITKRNVLEKRFLLVIPFYGYEMGIKSSFSLTVKNKQKAVPYPKSYIIQKAKIAMYPKRDNLERQAARVGLKIRQLDTEELIRLFYSIYNPTAEEVKDAGDKEEFNEKT